MPRTVDDTVVSIEFDNKKFEKNAKQTMSTIDKLKAKLRFKKENRLSDNINREINNVDVSPMEAALHKFDLKCSAFEIARITGIQRIVNAAITAGANITRQLTTVPVSTGFAEYEEKMGSVQTIMAGTGESLENVKEALEKLNVYADKTIYSFKDMTSNIGKFTNAGVELGPAVDAIRGVSNVAALSGASAAEASRAMYNLAQSLSAGYVKLIDWKSIENANMATKTFKKSLLDTAAAYGKVKKNADGTYRTLKGTALSATRNFNETLQEQWLTSDVLIKTLRDYADETTEIGKKAYAAAQDVKTLSMLFDTLKEAVQSGWGTTWELVIGDFEEAKEYLTTMSDAFSAVIGKIADARNYLLMGGLSKQTNNWKKITNAVENAGIKTDEFNNTLIEVGRNYVANLDDIIASSGSFDESLSKGWLNADIITEAFGRFNKAINSNLTDYTDQQKKIINELYKQAQQKGSIINNLIANMDKYGKTSGRELLLAGVTNMFTAAIRFIRALSSGVNAAFGKVNSKNIYELAERFNKFTQSLILSDEKFEKVARTARGAANALKFVGNIIKTGLTFALKSVCALLGIAGDSLLDLSAGLGDWISNTIGSIKANEALRELLSTIATIIKVIVVLFASLFNAIRKNQKVVKGFNKILTFFSNLLKDISEFFLAGFVGISKWIDEVSKLDGFTFDNLVKAFELLDECIFSYIGNLGGIFSRTKATIDKITTALGGIWDGFVESFKTKYKEVYDAIDKVWKWISTFVQKKVKSLKDFDASENKGGILASIFGISISVLLIKTIRKIGAAINVAKDLISGFSDVAGETGLAIRRLSKGLTRYFNASAFIQLSIAIAILAGALIGLAFVPYDKLEAAIPILAKLAAVFLGLNVAMAVINKLGGTSSAPGGLIATLFAIILFVKNIATITEKLDLLSDLVEKWIKPIEDAKDGMDALKAFAKQLGKIGIVVALALGAVELFKVFMKALYATKDVSLKGAIGITAMLFACSLFVDKFIPMIDELYDGLYNLLDKLMFGVEWAIVGMNSEDKDSFFGVLILIIGGIIASLAILNKVLAKLAVQIKPAVGMVLQITISLIALWGAVKLWNMLDFDKEWPAIVSVIGSFVVLVAVITTMGRVLKDVNKFPKIGTALLSLSAAVFLIVGAIALMAFMTKNYKDATLSAAGIIAGIIAGLTIFTAVAKGDTFQGIANAILKIGIGIALVAGVIAILASILNEGNKDAVLSIAKYAGYLAIAIAGIWMVVTLIKTFNTKIQTIKSGEKASGNSTKTNYTTKRYEGVYQTILAFASLVAEIAGIIYLFAVNVKGKEAWTRVGLATGMVIAVVAAVAFCLRQITKIGQTGAAKTAKTSIGFTNKSVAALVSVIAGLSFLISMIIPIAELDMGKVIAAGSVIAGITLALGGMLLMFSSMGASGKKAKNISGTMLTGLIVTLVALSGIVALIIPISQSPMNQIIAAGAVIAAIAIIMGVLIKMVYNIPKDTGTMTKNKLIALGLLIGGLAVIIAALALLAMNDMSSILASLGAVSGILAEIATIFIVFSTLSKDGGKVSPKTLSEISTAFILMSAAVAIIAASISVLANFETNKVDQAAASISTVVLILGLVMFLFSQTKFDAASMTSAATSFVVMTAGVLVIAGALTLLSALGNSDGIIKVAFALSIVIGAVALVISLFSLLDKGQMLLGALSFDIMTIGVLIIAASLEKLGSIDTGKLYAAVGAIVLVTAAVAALAIGLGALEVGTAGIGGLIVGAGIATLLALAGTILVIANSIEKVANSYEKLKDSTAVLPVLVKAFKVELMELIGSAADKAETAYSTAKDILTGFCDGVKDGIIEAMPSIYETISNAFTGVGDLMSAEIDNLLLKLSNRTVDFEATGVGLVYGIRTGMNDMEKPTYKNATRIGNNILTSVKNTAELYSDYTGSKVTKKMGTGMGTSLATGLLGTKEQAYAGGQVLGAASVLGISDGANAAANSEKVNLAVGPDQNKFSLKNVAGQALGFNIGTGDLTSGLESVLGNITDSIGGLFGDQTLGRRSGKSEYTEKYDNQLYEDEQKRIDKLNENIKSIIKSLPDYDREGLMYTPSKDKFRSEMEYFFKNYNLYKKQNDGLNQEYMVLRALNYIKDIPNASVKREDLILLWDKLGSALPQELYRSTTNGIQEAGKKMYEELGMDDFDIKTFLNGVLGKGSVLDKNTQGILDSNNLTNEILGSGLASEKSYTFVQNNYSPKALSTVEIYRQTNNQLSRLGRKGW